MVSFRRDANLTSDMIVNKTSFAGQNAVIQYKTNGGYFSHIIITQNGWVVSMGGRDSSESSHSLEQLASSIISKNQIENSDIKKADSLVRDNTWGHFVIVSPDDQAGYAAYDGRSKSDSNNIVQMKAGDYIKVPNNPSFYDFGQYSSVSKDPVDAAIKIAGTDTYGLDRKDITTYEYINNSTTSLVNVWASFDGGAMVSGARGTPDDVNFMGNITAGNQLPKIPSKKYIGQVNLTQTNQTTQKGFNLDIIVDLWGIIKTVSNTYISAYDIQT